MRARAEVKQKEKVECCHGAFAILSETPSEGEISCLTVCRPSPPHEPLSVDPCFILLHSLIKTFQFGAGFHLQP